MKLPLLQFMCVVDIILYALHSKVETGHLSERPRPNPPFNPGHDLSS